MQEITNDIITRAAGGDMNAFEQIYKAASGFVYTIAIRILQSKQDAEEVTQDIFISIYKNLKNFQFNSSLKTWIYRIACNASINAAKRLTRERSRTVRDEEGMIENYSAEDTARQEIHKNDIQNAVNALLNKLNPDQRACMVLRAIEGMNYNEISDVLGININTVRSRLKRAREKLIFSQRGVIKNEL